MPTDRTDKPAAHGDRRLAEQDSRIAERGYTPPKGRVSMADFSDLPAGPAPGATAAAEPAEQDVLSRRHQRRHHPSRRMSSLTVG